MYQFVLIVHIIAAACLIVLVLVQQGKGATVGASFGAGASQTIFGSRGAGSFLLRLTLGFVFVFFGTSIALNWLSSHAVRQDQVQGAELPAGLLEQGPVMPTEQTPATTVPAASGVIPALSPVTEHEAVPVSLQAPTTAAPVKKHPLKASHAATSQTATQHTASKSLTTKHATAKQTTSSHSGVKQSGSTDKKHKTKKHTKKQHQNNG